jgi:hypothetical protein
MSNVTAILKKMAGRTSCLRPVLRVFPLCALLLSASACIEDKGSYSYHDVNSITISGINDENSAYLVAVGEYLNITPTLEFSLDEEHDTYRYEWHQMGENIPHPSVRLLSTERNLSLKIEGSMRYSRTYILMYCVTNLTTGVRYDHQFKVTVQNRIEKGYIVLHEQSDDSFDLDLIASYGDSLTHYAKLLNMFESTLPKTGRKPLDVLCYLDHTAPSPYYVGSKLSYSVWVLTDKSTDRIKAEDFSYAEDFNISKLSLMPASLLGETELVAQKMVAGSTNLPRCYMYFNGCWFFFNQSPMLYFFEQPINVLSTSPPSLPYAVAPYIITVSNNHGAILFDEAQRRFMVHITNSGDMFTSSKLFCSHPINSAETYFPWENPNYRLLYMGNRTVYEGGFAVVKDISTGSFHLLQMRLNSGGVVDQLGKSNFPSSFDAEAVKHFAYHPKLPYLYCATEDRIYRVLVSTVPMTVTDVTNQVLPAGHKVSLMKFLFMRAPRSGLLALATYDSSGAAGQNGALSFYAAEDGTGALSLAKHPVEPANDGYQIDMKWQGFGKIVGLDYKEQ